MRIGIIGYGKMGKRIAELAEAEGHTIAYKISSHNKSDIDKIENIDVVIEFTNPDSALGNFEVLSSKGIPTVTGSTGWVDKLEEVETMFAKNSTPFFYASNFSIGVFISRATLKYLSNLLSQHPEYKGELKEWHHTAKLDAPSGTAISMAEDVLDNHVEYEQIAFEKKSLAAGDFPVSSYREGNIPGTHEIIFESDVDKIQLRHEAKNRDGFAKGALRAAEFLVGQEPRTYTMNDLINISL